MIIEVQLNLNTEVLTLSNEKKEIKFFLPKLPVNPIEQVRLEFKGLFTDGYNLTPVLNGVTATAGKEVGIYTFADNAPVKGDNVLTLEGDKVELTGASLFIDSIEFVTFQEEVEVEYNDLSNKVKALEDFAQETLDTVNGLSVVLGAKLKDLKELEGEVKTLTQQVTITHELTASDSYETPDEVIVDLKDEPPVSGDHNWFSLNFEGNQSNDSGWITDAPNSLRRNAMYRTKQGKIIYDTNQTANKYVQYNIVKDGSLREGRNHLHLIADVPASKNAGLDGIYRAQVQPFTNKYLKAEYEKAANKYRGGADDNSFVKAGWDNWWTDLDQTLVSRFWFRVPENMPLDKWPSTGISNGMDDPSSLQIMQWRSRYHEKGIGNIPFHLYWQKDVIWAHTQWDKSTKAFKDGRMSPVVADIVPGRAIKFVVFLTPNDKGNGEIKVYRQYEGEDRLKLVYQYKGDFYGIANDTNVNQGTIPKRMLGNVTFGLYPSVRMTGGRGDRWTFPVEAEFSEVELLQFNRDAINHEAILHDSNTW